MLGGYEHQRIDHRLRDRVYVSDQEAWNNSTHAETLSFGCTGANPCVDVDVVVQLMLEVRGVT